LIDIIEDNRSLYVHKGKRWWWFPIKYNIERNGDSREREREHRPIEQACPGTSHGTRVHKEFAVVPNSLKTEMIAGVNYEETNGKEVLGYT